MYSDKNLNMQDNNMNNVPIKNTQINQDIYKDNNYQTNNLMYSNDNQQINGNQSTKQSNKNYLGAIIEIIPSIIKGVSTVIGKELFSNQSEKSNIKIAENYTESSLQGVAKVRYKLTNPTFLWDCNDNFGTAEIDTVLLASENGKIVENYHDINEVSGVYFQVREDILKSESTLRKEYRDWLKIDDLQVTDIEDEVFSRHLKGETNNIYFESYCFEYTHIFEEGEDWKIYYSIELLLYKKYYDKNLINNVINEYHTIINTFEFVK